MVARTSGKTAYYSARLHHGRKTGRFPNIRCVLANGLRGLRRSGLCWVITKRSLTDIEEALDDLLPNYNLGNEKVRKLYVALSGDKVHEAKFWSAFQEHVTRRNKVVHEGKEVTRDEAEASLMAATELIRSGLINVSRG